MLQLYMCAQPHPAGTRGSALPREANRRRRQMSGAPPPCLYPASACNVCSSYAVVGESPSLSPQLGTLFSGAGT